MQQLKRVMAWIAGIVVVLIIGLAASIAIEGWRGPARVATLTNTVIDDEGELWVGSVTDPSGVSVRPEWPSSTDTASMS